VGRGVGIWVGVDVGSSLVVRVPPWSSTAVGWLEVAATATPVPPALRAAAAIAMAMSFERFVVRTDIGRPFVCAASAAGGDWRIAMSPPSLPTLR
jgi:hypothetical protein